MTKKELLGCVDNITNILEEISRLLPDDEYRSMLLSDLQDRVSGIYETEEIMKKLKSRDY